MATSALAELIEGNRENIMARCVEKIPSEAGGPQALADALGLARFLDLVVSELRSGPSKTQAIRDGALDHGRDRYADGYTVGQLVHNYGSICQAVTDLAVETGASIEATDFRTLNRCLDDAIAFAVTEFANQERGHGDRQTIRLRNLVFSVGMAVEAIRGGKVAVAGATGDLLDRSLAALRALADERSS